MKFIYRVTHKGWDWKNGRKFLTNDVPEVKLRSKWLSNIMTYLWFGKETNKFKVAGNRE